MDKSSMNGKPRMTVMAEMATGNYVTKGFVFFRCSDKTLVMSHPSKTPVDRPQVPQILKVKKQ